MILVEVVEVVEIEHCGPIRSRVRLSDNSLLSTRSAIETFAEVQFQTYIIKYSMRDSKIELLLVVDAWRVLPSARGLW